MYFFKSKDRESSNNNDCEVICDIVKQEKASEVNSFPSDVAEHVGQIYNFCQFLEAKVKNE